MSKDKILKIIHTEDYTLAIDEKAKIKNNDFVYDIPFGVVKCNESNVKENHYRTNIDTHGGVISTKLIKPFKIIASFPEIKGLPLLPDPFKRVNYSDFEAEKLAQEYTMSIFGELDDFTDVTEAFKRGYKVAKPKQFSLEDMQKAINLSRHIGSEGDVWKFTEEEIIQSLPIQSLPKEFIPEMYPSYPTYDGFEEDDFDPIYVPMTTTKSDGKTVLVGAYKY